MTKSITIIRHYFLFGFIAILVALTAGVTLSQSAAAQTSFTSFTCPISVSLRLDALARAPLNADFMSDPAWSAAFLTQNWRLSGSNAEGTDLVCSYVRILHPGELREFNRDRFYRAELRHPIPDGYVCRLVGTGPNQNCALSAPTTETIRPLPGIEIRPINPNIFIQPPGQ